ncbi:MAG: hypothetical protein EXR50_05950 [Dehalococcoidia bacterium]|nr:hypothetical protein [Dehalococcoidia bacterium]
MDAVGQFILGLTAWVFLLFSLRFSSWQERCQVITMVLVATGFECFGSLILRAYVYRLDNLPIYVPPGHGLFYLYALRVSELPLLQRHTRITVWAALFGATALLLHNLADSAHPDMFGLVTWLAFLACLIRTGSSLYAVSFAMTMALEFYGTALGNWKWAAVLPVLGVSSANPPACIGVGYCVMDATARRIAPGVYSVIGGHLDYHRDSIQPLLRTFATARTRLSIRSHNQPLSSEALKRHGGERPAIEEIPPATRI